MFRDDRGRVHYCEVKLGDNHDTGKNSDITRKLLMTSAGLVRLYGIEDPGLFTAHVGFVRPGTRGGDIRLPEGSVLRGDGFLRRFTGVSHGALELAKERTAASPEMRALMSGSPARVEAILAAA